MIERIRPIVAAVHPRMIDELKIRQKQFEIETRRPIKGGLTIFSEIAAEELKYMRMSGDELTKLLKSLKISPVEIEQFGEKRLFMSFEDFKKFFRVATALNKKKDQNHIKLEIQKIKGLKKNEVKFLW